MNKKLFWIIPIIILSIFLLFVILGTLTKDKTSTDKNQDKSMEISISLQKGFSLSPVSYSSEDFTDFFKIASENSKIITWAGNWEFLKDKTSAPHVVQTLSKKYNYEPIIITNIDENNPEYAQTIISFVKEYKPRYIGLGNEMNLENNLNAKAETFNKVYDEIKKVSPETKVFTIFQLEKMKQANSWEIINDFSKADLIAFTTYPVIIYQTPSEIPQNYYSEITQKTSKQIAFTEVGWQRKNNEQIEFIKIFKAQTCSWRIGIIEKKYSFTRNIELWAII